MSILPGEHNLLLTVTVHVRHAGVHLAVIPVSLDLGISERQRPKEISV